MKNPGLIKLRQLSIQEKKNKYPSIPYHALPVSKFDPKTSNGLTRCIISFIKLKGFQAERISSTGRLIGQSKTSIDVIGRARNIGHKQWIKTSGTKGTADISAIIEGRSIKIEIKIGKDSQSSYQLEYQKEVERSGGIYIIAKEFEGFYIWYNETFEQKKPLTYVRGGFNISL